MVKAVVVSLSLLIAGANLFAQQIQPGVLESRDRSYATAGRPPASLNALNRTAALCDLNLAARSRTRKTIGGLIMIGGIVAPMLAMPFQRANFTTPLAGAAIVGVGGYIRYYGNGYEGIWTSTMSAVKVGKTTRAELTECLGRPSSMTSGTAGDFSTWIASKPGVFSGGNYKMATVSFRSNVVTGVNGSDTRQ